MRRSQRGFATIEILAAVTLVAIMLLSIAAMYLTAHSTVERSGNSTVAVAVARQALEEMRSLPYDSLVELDGFDTTLISSLPSNDPERTLARKWRYAVAGESDGWSYTTAEKTKWSSFAGEGATMQGRIDVTSPSTSLRAVTTTLIIPGHPNDVQLATLISRTDP